MPVVKRNRGCKVCAKTIIRKKSIADMEDTNTNVPDEVAKQEIDLLFRKYKDYLLEATELRQTFQHTLAKAKTLEKNGKAVKKIESMERIEKQRVSAARTRRLIVYREQQLAYCK